jgi:hypothetical protein
LENSILRFRVSYFALALLTIPFLLGCEKRDPTWKATYPLTGTLIVDGSPAEGVLVEATDVKGLDATNPTMSTAFTDANGQFKFSTYEQGDGVPDGEYLVTFMWGTLNPMSMQYGGPDKLKNRYNDPEKSEFRVQVAGKPVDMGRIELSTE